MSALETLDEVLRGVPAHAASDKLDDALYAEAARVLQAMARAVIDSPLPEPFKRECRAVLDGNAEAIVRAVTREDEPSQVAGFLAWKAIARSLDPRERTGTKRECPTCGALPGMAQLKATDRGRERVLVCGRCATRWTYARIGCAFCGNDEVDQLGVLEPEDDKDFRIDWCRKCHAYVKTYVGSGNPLALSDWSTLHLDAACAGRGLVRAGASLYSL